MSLRLELPAGGVATVRFGMSPMFELAALIRRLRSGIRGPLSAPRWMRWRGALQRLDGSGDVGLVLQLFTARQGSIIWVPGTPAMCRSFDDDLHAIAALSDDVLAADLEPYVGPFDGCSRWRRQIESGLRQLWEALLADSWGAVRAVADQEVARATDVLQRDGWVGVFGRIGDKISWDGRALQLSGLPALPRSTTELVLAPSVFALSGPVARIGRSDPAVVFFPARGVGLLFSSRASGNAGLAALLGPHRARILALLQHPTTVSRLRDLLGLSLGSLSRHLAVITGTGLASSHRVGRTVQYELTQLGHDLLAAQDAADSDTV